MSDLPLPEDEALLYVLGRLHPAERRAFEARLVKSESLRAQVRELEAGAVALAMAAPQREPPAQVWKQIEEAVGAEASRKIVAPAFRETVRRHGGWLAAAACLIGWLLYAAWIHRAQTPAASQPELLANDSSLETMPPIIPFNEAQWIVPRPLTPTNIVEVRPRSSSLAQTGEIASLRRQVRELENHLLQLSQVVTQQQTLLSESSRLTLFRLAPQNSPGQPGPAAPPSPEVQRALLLALARQLGWLQTQGAGNNQGADSGSQPASDSGVDFVDLQPAGETPPGTQPVIGESDTPTNLLAQTETPRDAPSNSAVPGAMFNTNAFLVFNTASAPLSSGPWTAWTVNGGGQLQAQSFFQVGNNQVVVGIPYNGANLNATLYIQPGTMPGLFNPSNGLGPFVLPAPAPPQ